ncbi:MAG: hypothetical protein JST80_12115 [Bdellovibrionales bacterium]|nr:hypothetical protein [Bdellovibrionales bacterium]
MKLIKTVSVVVLALFLTTTKGYATFIGAKDPLCSSEIYKQAWSLLQENQDMYNAFRHQLSVNQTVESLLASATPEYCMAVGKSTLAMYMMQKSLSRSQNPGEFSDFIKTLRKAERKLTDTCASKEVQQFSANDIYQTTEGIKNAVSDLNRRLGCQD